MNRRARVALCTGLLTLLLGSAAALPARPAGPGAPPASAATRRLLNPRLLAAARAGQAAQVAALLRAGADVNASDSGGRTALTWAALGDHVAVARVLITAGADPDRQDAQRNNALLVTGETGSVALLREVLRARPDLRRTNRFGGTALIPAADRGHLAYVRELLRTTKIDVNHVNHLGWTALLEAVILGDGGPTHTAIVRELLSHGADPRIADRDGVSALEHARRRGYAAMVKLLQGTD